MELDRRLSCVARVRSIALARGRCMKLGLWLLLHCVVAALIY
jgi:hypothetical protein